MTNEEIIRYYEIAKEFNEKAHKLQQWIDDNFDDDFIDKILKYDMYKNKVYDDAVKLVSEANEILGVLL